MNRIISSACIAVLALGMLPLAYGQEGKERGKAVQAEMEQLLIQAQKICPVSGEELGSMGKPLKAKSGERTIFLCCKGCVGQEINAKHWQTIQANLAAAQEICPVMKKKLPADPASIVVKNRAVFVCCKPCTKKIAADPDKYLAVVDSQLVKNLDMDKDTK